VPLGTEVGLGPGHIMLDWDLALPTEKGTAAPTFAVLSLRPYKPRPMSIVAKGLNEPGCHLVQR